MVPDAAPPLLVGLATGRAVSVASRAHYYTLSRSISQARVHLLRDDGDDDAAPDLHAAIVAARAAVQGFCEAYADEDPALAAILDALDAEERGDAAAVAAAAARLATPVAAADDTAGRWSDPTA